MHHHEQQERHLLVKVCLQVLFGLSCMILVQKQLIDLLTGQIANFAAYALAFIVSGAVDFLLNYFITHGRRGRVSREHFRHTDWRHFRLSAKRQAAATSVSSLFNGAAITLLIRLGWFQSPLLVVLLANMASGIINQLLKLFIVYRRQPHAHKARREERF